VNRKQEILLWIVGLPASAFIYRQLTIHTEAITYDVARIAIDEGIILSEQMSMLTANPAYAWGQLLSFLLPLFIVTGLLCVSLRS